LIVDAGGEEEIDLSAQAGAAFGGGEGEVEGDAEPGVIAPEFGEEDP
jgi:hypothetical protein